MPKSLTRESVQALRKSLTSEAMMMHAPVLGQWLATFEEALSESWRDPEQLRAALGVRAQTDRMRITGGGVAVISVSGMIRHKNDVWVRYGFGVSNLQVAADVLEAVNNPKIKGVVLDVDSPGGLAMGNEEASTLIYNARGDKPIVASVNGYGASAAYYLSAAANKVFASASSITPSVGTLLVHFDYSQYLADFGAKATLITYGANKGAGNMYEPLSPKSKALLQQFVDGHGEQFVNAVARYRGITAKEVNERYGQGWIFSTAKAALDAGVIDGIANLDDVIASVAGEADRQEATAAVAISGRLLGSRTSFSLADGTLQAGWQTADSLGAEASETTAATPPQSQSDSAEQSAQPCSTQERTTVTKRIKAALYALGLVDNQEASDEVFNAALNAFYVARHKTRSQDEQQILKDLSAAMAGEGAAQTSQTADPPPGKKQEAKADVSGPEETERRADIRATGAKFKIDQAVIDKAIDSNLSHAAFAQQVLEQLNEREAPLGTDSHAAITFVDAQGDKLVDCFTHVMCDRFGIDTKDEKKPDGFYQMQSASIMQFVRADMGQRGIAMRYESENAMCKAYLKLEAHDFDIVGFGQAMNSAGSVQRSGDFPNMLSALANKIMNVGIDLAMPTYQEYSWRMPNVPDYNPRTIHDIGGFDELDLVFEDDDPKQLKLSEEVAWIKADSFANKWGLTDRMMVQGDISKWTRGLQGLGTAAENTVNRLNLYLVVGNAEAHDGTALFHADHGNDITDGGAPSATESTKMKALFRQQTGIGGKGKLREPPAIALVPSNHEDAADATFLTIARLAESKVANVDTNINVHRGRIKPVVEPELDTFSTDVWYLFANPQRRPVIAHAFLVGFGPGGRRRSYVDPATGTRFYVMEQHVGAAVVGYRGAVRNDGTAAG